MNNITQRQRWLSALPGGPAWRGSGRIYYLNKTSNGLLNICLRVLWFIRKPQQFHIYMSAFCFDVLNVVNSLLLVKIYLYTWLFHDSVFFLTTYFLPFPVSITYTEMDNTHAVLYFLLTLLTLSIVASVFHFILFSYFAVVVFMSKNM